jgi:hypothetical protein
MITERESEQIRERLTRAEAHLALAREEMDRIVTLMEIMIETFERSAKKQ